MPRVLLDANLSPETAKFLRTLDISANSIQEQGLGRLSDEEIIAIGKKESRMIITFDYDFAELWYFKEWGTVGIIHLRTKLQTVEHVNPVLGNFLSNGIIEKESLQQSLIVLDESEYRVVR